MPENGSLSDIRSLLARIPQEYYLLALCIAVGLVIRVLLAGFESGDYNNFLKPWYHYISSRGGLPAFRDDFSDYTPAYLYLLAIAYYVGAPDLVAVKGISILGDLVLAIVVYLLAFEVSRNRTVACIGCGLVFLAPTIVLNGAFWGQSDGLYTLCILASLLFLLKDRPLAGTVLYGLGFAIKLQAIFFAPVFLFLILKGRYQLRYLAIIPGVYLLTVIPAFIAGRPLGELLMVYPDQAGFYKELCWNAPSIYAAFPSGVYETFVVTGSLFAVMAALVLIYVLSRGPLPVQPATYVSVAFITVLLVPFLLPAMHERYFYLADVLSVLYACCYPKRFYIPAVMVAVSFFAYMPFLFKAEPVPLIFLAAVLFCLLLHVTDCAIRERFGSWPVFDARAQG